MNLLDRISGRRPVSEHDGRSGARIERGMLDGSVPVYVKTSPLASDLAALVTGTGLRERDLLHAGVFHSLPGGVGCALVGVEQVGEVVVTVTHDMGDAVLRWDRVLSREEVCRIFTAITAVHEAFRGDPPAGLCPLEVRLDLLGPRHLPQARAANPELGAAIARGWEVFFDLVASDVATAVVAVQRDPAALAAALARQGTTLLHGDFWLVNLAVADHQVTPMDWGLATDGPGVLDLITFCVGGMSNVVLSRDELLAEARAASRGSADDELFALAEFWALVESGWNKALDAVDNPDPVKRATERADLDFWVARGRTALHSRSFAG